MGKLLDKITEGWASEDYDKAIDITDKVLYGTVFVGTCAIMYLQGKNVGYSQGLKYGFDLGKVYGSHEILSGIFYAIVGKRG